MTPRTISFFKDETYSKGPKKKYFYNKIEVYHNNDSGNLDILHLEDYCLQNNRAYSCTLVVIDVFNKFGVTIPLKNKNAQTLTTILKTFSIHHKEDQNCLKQMTVKNLKKKLFTNLLSENYNKRQSRSTSLGAVFAERLNRTIIDLIGKTVSERRDELIYYQE